MNLMYIYIYTYVYTTFRWILSIAHMKTLLATALAGEDALTTAPPLLAVRIPQYWDRGAGNGRTRFWLTTSARGDDGFLASWGGDDDVNITLGVNGTGVVYCLRAYVQYTGMSELDEPTEVLRHPEGHFIAHFYDAASGWYRANDSVVTRKEDAGPHAFPYICFFEREDSRRHHAMQRPWMCAEALDVDGVDDAVEVCDDAECSGGDDEGDDGGSTSVLPAAKRRRMTCKQRRSQAYPEHALPLKRRIQACNASAAPKKPTGIRMQLRRNTRDQRGSGAEDGNMQKKPAAVRMRSKRKQDRSERKQDRSERKQERKEDRSERKQERKQDRSERKQERKRDRSGRNREEDLRSCRARESADNTDGSRRDAQSNQCNPLLGESKMHETLKQARKDRHHYGNVFLLLQLLTPFLDGKSIIAELPAFYDYAGDDCACRWSTYLGDASRPSCMFDRLSEALGVTAYEIESAQHHIDSGDWTLAQIAQQLDTHLLGLAEAPASLQRLLQRHKPAQDVSAAEGGPPNPVADFLERSVVETRRPFCSSGMPQHSAMPPRLRDRSPWFRGALPTLQFSCQMCEAEFPNRQRFEQHVDKIHGTSRWYQCALVNRLSIQPYVVSPTEKRKVIKRFAASQHFATMDPENEPYQPRLAPEIQGQMLWTAAFRQCAQRLLGECEDKTQAGAKGATGSEISAVHRYEADLVISPAVEPEPLRPRAFQACVFCAMLHWSETLYREYLAGAKCTIPSPSLVADLLDVKWYETEWKLIPREELEASAVDFPHPAEDDSGVTTTKVLMHKRRVPDEALAGEEPVCVCRDCRDALWKRKPTMPRYSLANWLWLGRHPPLFRMATIGHQLLLALGRVVSTKVYLSSKGVDEVARQHRESWRQKFLQFGMAGTAIVFGNGSLDHAMAEFPPSGNELQDTFVAVFTGPEQSMGVQLTEYQQEEMARQALRKEVEFQIDKKILDEQADTLMATNYVYKGRATYRKERLADFPDQRAVPACLEACAKFIPTTSAMEDSTQAHGPSTSTTAACQEHDAAEAEDAVELTKWMSVIDEQQDDVAEMTSLPAMQGLLERMESQAGRIVANELAAAVEGSCNKSLDEIGRTRLRTLCADFHWQCSKMSRDDEIKQLQWRVQALARGSAPCSATPAPENAPTPCDDAQRSQGGPSDDPAQRDDTRPQGLPVDETEASAARPKQLRATTTRKAESWWSPEYWSIARPTDFCYGDCVWGLDMSGKQWLVPLSVIEWERNVLRREELEYTLPGEGAQYVATATNRFRDSWYDIHLISSFWRVTETTKSVLSCMKTPGFYAASRASADITPEMMAEVQLKAQQGGKKTTLQSVLSDKDLPKQVRTAFASLHQATGSLIGSDGHRRQLRGEGEAYTLRFGPPLEFVTPNLADNKQPLLLIVQGEKFDFEREVEVSYREMTQRLARDPVGQAVVFELMIRLFFIHVLGVRPELVGWERGAVRKAAERWAGDGVAQDWPHVGLFGLIAAAFGPVEAQGRGSLHPHILVWLLQSSMQDVLAVLLRDRTSFKARLNKWMRQVIQAVVAAQESAVTELPKHMQGGEDRAAAAVKPLPLGPKERKYFQADGGVEVGTAAELGLEDGEAPRELSFYVPDQDGGTGTAAIRVDLPYRNNAGDIVDREEWTTEYECSTKGLWSKPISAWPSGTLPAYRHAECKAHTQSTQVAPTLCDDAHLSQGVPSDDQAGEDPLQALRGAMPSEEFIRSMCHDARDLVIGAAVHVCSPSCYKYHSKGGSHICRHNFYHVVTLYDEADTELRVRRRGKPLRGCIGIFRDTRFGMAGRIITYQVHPWECSTNYAALVAMRCNVDVQDLRRVLPPTMWMPADELEPAGREEEGKTYTHGAYPQRFKGSPYHMTPKSRKSKSVTS